MNSILQKQKECYICHTVNWIEEHHAFGGGLRKKSEQYGLKFYLCHYCHNEPPRGAHHNRETDLMLKRMAQKAFEDEHGHDMFMKEFGRNYLD